MTNENATQNGIFTDLRLYLVMTEKGFGPRNFAWKVERTKIISRRASNHVTSTCVHYRYLALRIRNFEISHVQYLWKLKSEKKINRLRKVNTQIK